VSIIGGGDIAGIGGDIDLHNSTKRSLNLVPFGKISKSGDGGGSGDTFNTKGRIVIAIIELSYCFGYASDSNVMS
jgi:hypothetical protein